MVSRTEHRDYVTCMDVADVSKGQAAGARLLACGGYDRTVTLWEMDKTVGGAKHKWRRLTKAADLASTS